MVSASVINPTPTTQPSTLNHPPIDSPGSVNVESPMSSPIAGSPTSGHSLTSAKDNNKNSSKPEDKPDQFGGNQSSWLAINDPQLLIPKMLYFFLNSVVYSTHSFIGKHLTKVMNIPPEGYGFINAITIVNFGGAIFWANLADRFKAHKAILIWTVPAFAAVFCLMAFNWNEVLGVSMTDKGKYEASWGVRSIILAINAVFYFISSASFPLLDNAVLGILAQNPSFSKEIFGRQRLWGTIGHTLSVAFTEMLGDYMDNLGWKDKSMQGTWKFRLANHLMFVLMMMWAVLFSLTAFVGIPSGLEPVKGGGHHGHHGGAQEKSKEETAAEAQQESRSPFVRLIRIPTFLLFLGCVLIAGYIRSVTAYFANYLVQHEKEKPLPFLDSMQKEIVAKLTDQNKLPAGEESRVNEDAARVAIKAIRSKLSPKDPWTSYNQFSKLISELGVFFFGKQVMGYIGVHWMLLFSQLAGAARVMGYSFMDDKNKPLGLCWEFLKGLSTGLFFSATVRIASDIAPPGCGNSAQGIMSATYSGIASSLAGILGGLHIYLYKMHKGVGEAEWNHDLESIRSMFFLSSLIGFGFLIVFFCKFAFVDRVILTGKRAGPMKPGASVV